MQNDQLARLQQATAAAVARGDIAAMRRALRVGATFASFTIRQRTEVAERHFSQWVAAGMPEDVRDAGITAMHTQKNARLAGIAALSDEDVLAIFHAPVGIAAYYFADRVSGYGAAKANFAVACAGAKGAGACFDSHLLRQHEDAVVRSGWVKFASVGYPRAAGVGKRHDYIASYEALVTELWGPEHGHGQWTAWLQDYARGCKHSPLLDTIREVTA